MQVNTRPPDRGSHHPKPDVSGQEVSTLGAVALSYASGNALGRAAPVFPLAPGAKAPHPRLPRLAAGAGGFKHASADLVQIAQWWVRWPLANIGAALEPALLVVLDVEGPSKGYEPRDTHAALADAFGPLPPTYATRTAGGGWHAFYARPPGSAARSLPVVRGPAGVVSGVEVKATGYVVLPPSRLWGGGAWRVARELPLATAPAWMLPPPVPERAKAPPAPRRFGADRDGTPYGLAALAGERERLLSASEGQRHNQCFASARAVGMLVAGGELSGEFAIAEVRRAAAARGLDGRREQERERTIADGLAAGVPYPRRAPERAA